MLLIQNILTPAKARSLRNLRIHGVRIEGRTIHIRLGNITIRPWEVRKVDLDKSDYRITSLLKAGAITIVDSPHVVTYTTPSPPKKPVAETEKEEVGEIKEKDLSEILNSKSMAELRRILKNLGGKPARSDKKQDLIDKILSLIE